MGNRQSRDSEADRGESRSENSEEPRVSALRRESEEVTAPLYTAGYAGDKASKASSHLGQTSNGEDGDDSLDRESSLRGRLNPVGGGE